MKKRSLGSFKEIKLHSRQKKINILCADLCRIIRVFSGRCSIRKLCRSPAKTYLYICLTHLCELWIQTSSWHFRAVFRSYSRARSCRKLRLYFVPVVCCYSISQSGHARMHSAMLPQLDLCPITAMQQLLFPWSCQQSQLLPLPPPQRTAALNVQAVILRKIASLLQKGEKGERECRRRMFFSCFLLHHSKKDEMRWESC